MVSCANRSFDTQLLADVCGPLGRRLRPDSGRAQSSNVPPMCLCTPTPVTCRAKRRVSLQTSWELRVNVHEHIVERFRGAQDRLVLQAADLSVASVASMVTAGAVDLEPAFQRRSRWSTEKQSALIESFLINVPVPPVYLSEMEFGRYAVVDGKQRITAMHAFMEGALPLVGMKSFPRLEGMQFDDLPAELQNALSIRPYVRVVTLLRQTDPALKYEVFIRLNRGGERMEAQEIRNVAFRGPLNDRIYEAAAHPFLRDRLKIRGPRSSAYQVMRDAEYVLRFLTMRGMWRDFSEDLRSEMDSFMTKNRDMSKRAAKLAVARFTRALEGCRSVFGLHAFQRPVGAGWRDQTLAGLYDAEMLAVDLLDDATLSTAIANRQRAEEGLRRLFGGSEFDTSVRTGTNTKKRVRYRVEEMAKMLGTLVS